MDFGIPNLIPINFFYLAIARDYQCEVIDLIPHKKMPDTILPSIF